MANPKIGKPEAGQGLSKGHTSKNFSSTEEVLKAVRDELTAFKAASSVAQASAPAQTGAYVQADVQAIADLANACKTALNNIAGILDKFSK